MRHYQQNWLKKFFLTAAMSLVLLPLQHKVEPPAVWAAPSVAAAETSLSKGVALRPGDTIGILAPASNDNIEDYDRAIRDLKKRGYKIKLGTSCRSRDGYSECIEELGKEESEVYDKKDRTSSFGFTFPCDRNFCW